MSHEHKDVAPTEQHDEQDAEQTEQNDDLEYDSFSDGVDPITFPEETSTAASSKDQIRIKSLEDEIAKTKEHMLRAVAEAENGRKRALKEREDASKFAVSGFSRDLISVADNLRRALDSIPAPLLEQNPEVKNLTDGIEATERELLRSFKKNGIEKIEPLNERFDPHFHEVMFETPMTDKEGGTIIQVLEPGYTIHGRILRPARVGIAKAIAPTTEPGQTINTEV